MFSSLKPVYSAVLLIYSFILDVLLENSFQLPGPTPSMLYFFVGREDELYRQRHSHMRIDERKASFLEKVNTRTTHSATLRPTSPSSSM